MATAASNGGPPAAAARGNPDGFGRSSSRAAERVSDDLRRGSGPYLTSRRRTVGLSLGAAASLGVVALYQTGILKHLPEPPLRFLDADKVDASGEAYQMFKLPDALLGIGSYTATAALAAMGGARRHRDSPWLPLLLAAKVAMDALWAGGLTVEQVSKHKALCSWCLATAAATFATVPQVVPEARAAVAALRRSV